MREQGFPAQGTSHVWHCPGAWSTKRKHLCPCESSPPLSFLEMTRASNWVRFDNKVVRDKVQSCCLYPKFSIAYRIAFRETLNWPRFIARINPPSSLHKPKIVKAPEALYFYCVFCQCLKISHKTVWIVLSTFGTCKRQTDPQKFS